MAGVDMENIIIEAELETPIEEDHKWSEFSLASAMRGMEDEDTL